MQPITLYGHHAGPNPKKVAMVLEELNLPYEIKLLEFPKMKQPAYEKVNPNGRVPAIQDPNTGLTLWESGAIIEYLVERYDEKREISFQPGSVESYHAKQEKIQSAVDRYVNEIRRVSGVLDGVLQGHEYLVDNRYSFADLAFVPWFGIIPWVAVDDVDMEKDFPNVHAWLERMKARPAVKKVLDAKSEVPKKL